MVLRVFESWLVCGSNARRIITIEHIIKKSDSILKRDSVIALWDTLHRFWKIRNLFYNTFYWILYTSINKDIFTTPTSKWNNFWRKHSLDMIGNAFESQLLYASYALSIISIECFLQKLFYFEVWAAFGRLFWQMIAELSQLIFLLVL